MRTNCRGSVELAAGGAMLGIALVVTLVIIVSKLESIPPGYV